MPSVNSTAPTPYQHFLGLQPQDAPAPDGAPPAPLVSKLARAARTCRQEAKWIAVQRLAGGNVPMQNLLDAFKADHGAQQRLLVEAGAGLLDRKALIGYACKDALCFAMERGLGATATWVTRSPRWVARALASAACAPLYGLRFADVSAWLGRPDYELPAACAALPLPAGCPSRTPGQLADWLEPWVGAVMLGASVYWAAPRLAFWLHTLNERRHAAPAESADSAAEGLEPLLPDHHAAPPLLPEAPDVEAAVPASSSSGLRRAQSI